MGTLKGPDGTTTITFEDTLNVLLNTHFPGCIRSTGTESAIIAQSISRNVRNQRAKLANVIISREKVKWAIGTFRPYKSPGPDGIFPAMLKYGAEELLQIVVTICKASLILSYIPESWKKVRVIFIPKGGGKAPDDPKSYRPINLSSFMLKTMEKLVDYHIREELLTRTPLHRWQFAYQKEKSTIGSTQTCPRN